MRNHATYTLFALALFAPLSALAQTGEIVVTATRAPVPAARLPSRIEVIDRTEIEALSLVSVTEAIGAEAVQAGGAGQQASVFLRGANSKHALALLDGVRLNDASTPNAQYDFGLDTLGALERVEVLRGPASAIYGSDAIGGVVNMIPRRGGEDALFAEIASGSFNTWRGHAGASGTADALEYGLTAEVLDTEGQDLVPERMSTRTGDPDGAEVNTLTASARYDFGAFALDGLARVRESETEFDTFSGGPFFSARADDPDLSNQALQQIWRLGADGALSESWILRAFAGQVLGERSEHDGGLETSSADAARTFAGAYARYESGETNLTAGIDVQNESIDTIPQFSDPLSAEEDQAGLYLIGQSPLGERFDVTGSVRVDDYESFGAQTTFALGVVADLDPVRLFASAGSAFKAPSLSERFETSLFNIGNPDLDPERSESWEIGADWSAGPTLTLGASYYQTRVTDLIEYDFALLQNVNIGRAEIDGAEAFAEAAPASWASLRLAYHWTDARNAITGAQLIRRPEHSWRFDARLAPLERVTLVLSWTFVGERGDVTYDDAGEFISGNGVADSYSVGALAATFALTEKLEAFARVDNVSDETYEQPAAFAGAPRAGYVGVRARF